MEKHLEELDAQIAQSKRDLEELYKKLAAQQTTAKN